MKVDETTEGRRLRKRKEKIPKNLKREASEKEMDGFTKRVLRIPVEKPFDEVYYTHRLWIFFRETKETEEDIRRMFHHVREMMKLRITLKKKSGPGKFAIRCVVKGIEFPQALCDTGASVSILPRVFHHMVLIFHSFKGFSDLEDVWDDLPVIRLKYNALDDFHHVEDFWDDVPVSRLKYNALGSLPDDFQEVFLRSLLPDQVESKLVFVDE
ncbi:hypothetical protein DY000_02009832 [Brassica cretica]|uniref:Aspartic peptidase DDI1-type domain-containing protein n=1 Tax=Brassica cretica TaxID=69181 RepID=A0ABQ7C0P9_BRACR|nr:hypothetical protein DY000_02009832 [Brassica cretica]